MENSWKMVFEWMDEVLKNERKYYSVPTQQKTLVRDMYAADVRYHLGYWLGVTVKYKPAGPVQLLQSLLLHLSGASATAQMVGCCYNNYECL